MHRAGCFGAFAFSGVLVLLFGACSASKSDRARAEQTGGSAGSRAGSGPGGGGFLFDSGAGGSSFADAGCASASIKSDLLPANLLFLVDRTGTMACNPPPITDTATCENSPLRADPAKPSRWEVIRDSLLGAVRTLPGTTSIGITFFSNDNECGVQSKPNVGVNRLDSAQLAALEAALNGVSPKGGTPIVGATILGYRHLHQQATLTGNKFVVLITDGAENCSPSDVQRLVDIEVPKALIAGIRTFVIGAPGSEPGRALLSQIAFAGGTARSADCDHSGAQVDAGDCHFDMTKTVDFSADLSAALATIGGRAITCEFEVPKSPDGRDVDYGKVNVIYTVGGSGNPEQILQDTSAPCDGGADGWQYNTDRTKIILCGASCTTVKRDPQAKIDIVLGCETVVK